MFETFLISLAASGVANLSLEALRAAFSHVAEIRPDLQRRAQAAEAAKNGVEIEKVFQEALGVIDASAEDGSIEIDGAALTALKGIRFDHAQGQVSIFGSAISAPVLVTGGQTGATGSTEIGSNTSLKSQGTEIKVGTGCKITMSGEANIKQS